MTAAATTIYDPMNGDFEAVDGELLPDMLTRRLKRRRQMFALAMLSHLINVGLLIVFAMAGTTSSTVVTAYTGCAALSVLIFFAISESGMADRLKDHFLAAPYTSVTFALQLAFIYVAPEVSVVFLCALFLVGNVVALRATSREGMAAWLLMSGSVAVLFVLTKLPLSLPSATPVERIATLLTFSLTVGRIMFIGVFSSRLRDDLYRRRVELEAAYKRIEELAELDELTGSFNRRCIMRLLDDEAVRAQRSKAPCTVALIDLDWFKRINDKFGHPTGDEVLRTFAITMFANIRSIDKFGRYGGEEFLLVLPDTPHDKAMQMLDRLRMIIQSLDWSAFSDGLTVTISAGVATLDPHDTPDTLLARADSALYAAKERGRNRIASA
jgi:diguanylate cyclase (GGDEF)-like protein